VCASQQMRAGLSESSRLWGVTLGEEHVSRDRALRVIVTVNADANAKRRERAHLQEHGVGLYLLVEERVSVSSPVPI
jgi:hypothetical protein